MEGETLGEGDVPVVRETADDQAVEAAEGTTVVLDTTITDDLRREGLARESVNRVQNVRKAKGLDVRIQIDLRLVCGGELAAAARDERLAEMIRSETLAGSLSVQGTGEGDESFEVDSESLAVGVEAVRSP